MHIIYMGKSWRYKKINYVVGDGKVPDWSEMDSIKKYYSSGS